ncbi:MAG: chromosome segregation protein SMC, partial [Nitrosomonadales bacterium]|nr:chromosome segregation protein SMC [Nitrosomonadales bacterium]
IVRLEAQAVVTQQYHQLQTALKHAHGQLWLLKKRDAGIAWEKTKRQVEKLVNELEAQMANLRKTESTLESLRQQHFASSEAVQTAQTHYYETNAEVSNLEQQVKHTQEARERLSLQLQQLATQAEKLDAQRISLNESLAELLQQQTQADADEQRSNENLVSMKAQLPALESSFSSSQRALSEVQKTLADTEQAVRLETTQLGYAERNIEELQLRLQRLQADMQNLQLPDATNLQSKRDELAGIQKKSLQLEQQIGEMRVNEQQQIEAIKVLRLKQQDEHRIAAQLEAQIQSLRKIQSVIGHEAKLDEWLEQQGLQNAERLWQKISIADGWETALEAVLGARLNGILQPQAQLAGSTRPPSTIVIAENGAVTSSQQNAASQLVPLLSTLEQMAPEIAGLLEDWLAGVYLLEDLNDVVQARKQLQSGESLVTREGDIYTRYSLTVFSPQSALHGVLERQRELEALQSVLPQAQESVATTTNQLKLTEEGVRELQQSLQEQQQSLRNISQSGHQLTLDIQRQEQQLQHAMERKTAISQEMESLGAKIETAMSHK